MDKCRFCGCEKLYKRGIVDGKQRYSCTNCGKNQSDTDDRMKYTDDERSYAIKLYLEGNGFRRIERLMSSLFGKVYRHQTIMKWIKKAGGEALKKQEQQQTKIEVLEMDELHTYVKKK